MALSAALGMAIGKLAVGAGQKIKGSLQSKNADSAALVDPTQSAMVNLLHRERRASAVGGTSGDSARSALGRDSKNITRRSILGGKRDLSDYTKFRASNEKAIADSRATERLGMLKTLTDETRNIADRKMDLVELDGERDRVAGEAIKQTGAKNMMATLPGLQDALSGGSGSKKKKSGALGEGIKGAIEGN